MVLTECFYELYRGREEVECGKSEDKTMSEELSHSAFYERAVRYLSGEMPDKERRVFEEELAGDREKRERLDEFRKIWTGVELIRSRGAYDMDEEWNVLRDKMGWSGAEKGKGDGTDGISRDAKKAGEVAKKEGRPVRMLRYYLVRIAAALVIGFLGVAGWYYGRQALWYDHYAVERGTEVFQLPDGSEVTLNEGSELAWHKRSGSSERKVKLEGEAYFEVVRNPSVPFRIEAGAAQVEVLGTRFNVRAYKDIETVEVTVESGVVAMRSDRGDTGELVLKKGNSGVYYRSDRELELVNEADPNVLAWKTREIVFDRTSLADAAEVISRVYHIPVELADPALGRCEITVTFREQELEAVLHVLTGMLDLEVKRRGDRIVLDGPGCRGSD